MIRLLPWLRAFHAGPDRQLEAVLHERSVLLDDVLLAVVRGLARGPAASSTELCERIGIAPADKGAVHARLSVLAGLGLIATTQADPGTDALWRALAERMPEVPTVDNVELTNICPMTCAMCPTGSGRMTRPKARMERALFARLVSELAPGKNGGKPLALHNLGESALHPELASFVQVAADAGLTTELSSNPGHMPLALFRSLEDAGLSRLVLSVDGIDAATLMSIRGPGARADVAFSNLEAILTHRRARPSRTTLVLQMIRQHRNAHQASAFLARYGALQLPGVAAYVKELDANTVQQDEVLYEIGRPRRPYLCRAPWRTVVVLANGDVVPCCHDANGAVPYGNLNNESLRDLWRGDAARALRERLTSGSTRADEPCGTCAHRADRYPLPPLDEIPVEPLHW